VWGDVDLGPQAPASEVTVSAELVAGNLIRFWTGATLVSYPMDGRPAILAFHDRRLAAVLLLTLNDDGRIQSVHVIADPPVVGQIERQLTPRG
jgi:RNA polymerase sigma-70 factor (ECF subfamily)